MNRLVSTQIATEAAVLGKRVLVVTRDHEIPDAISDMTALPFAAEVDRIRRSHGEQAITYRGGGAVAFGDPRHGVLRRGFAADLVYIDTPFGHDERVVNEVGSTGGEVIRA